MFILALRDAADVGFWRDPDTVGCT